MPFSIPSGVLRPNRASPLSDRLSSFWVGRDNTLYDPYTGSRFVRSSSGTAAVPVSGALGRGWRFTTSMVSGECLAAPFDLRHKITNNPFTVVAWIRFNDSNDYSAVVDQYSTVQNGWALYTINATGRLNTFGFTYNNGNSGGWIESHAGTSLLSAGGLYLIGAYMLPGTAGVSRFYLNGAEKTPTYYVGSDGATAYAYTSTQDIWIGSDTWGQDLGSEVYAVGIWQRKLSLLEHQMLYQPETRWSMFTANDYEKSRGLNPSATRGIPSLGGL